MEVKDYLVVYGHNTVRGGSCYKESIIDCNDLVKFTEIIKTIINSKDKDVNWTSGIDLEHIGNTYIKHDRLIEMYPNLSPVLLHEFCMYLPDGITKIESIKIFSGEKIKIV